MEEKYISVRGANVNNLKNIAVDIPRGKLVVITGLSGSGKSSLAFDTLYAEGQRRYVESLSAYARQFLGRMKKPDCDFIMGLPPAIAIEQKVNSRNPRSTVGTSTEIYDYLRLLYSRIGKTYSPVSGQLVKKHTPDDLVQCMLTYSRGTRFTVLAPIMPQAGRTQKEQLAIYMQQGFTRIDVDGEIVRIEDWLIEGQQGVLGQQVNGSTGQRVNESTSGLGSTGQQVNKSTSGMRSTGQQVNESTSSAGVTGHAGCGVTGQATGAEGKGRKRNAKSAPSVPLYLVIDRLSVDDARETVSRLTDSAETAFFEGGGTCLLRFYPAQILHTFSTRFEADGITFEEPSDQLFSFNSPLGACPTCEGFGRIIGIDERLVIPDSTLSVYDGAVVCWRGEKMNEWRDAFILRAAAGDFPIFTPYYQLTQAQKDYLWHGARNEACIDSFFAMLEENQYKIQYRVMLARYRGKTLCPTCRGTRLKKEATYVKVGGRSICDLVEVPVSELKGFFDRLELDDHDRLIASRLLKEITSRLQFLLDVGLGYLTLNRLSNSLSGGESQRINLVTSLGSPLVGSLYILDEPSIGLHCRDTDKLIRVLRQLQREGNTVVVVEHDEDIIRAADYIIDVGPAAGRLGGEIVWQGSWPLPDPPLKGRELGMHTADPAWYRVLKEHAEANRKHPTEAESILWEALKNSASGYKFRRQHIIRDFIVDFYCVDKQVSIEIDGGYHNDSEQMVSDEQRTAELTQMGITEIRFTNDMVINDLEAVLQKIQETCQNAHPLLPDCTEDSPNPALGQNTCQYPEPLLQEGTGEASYTLRYLRGEEKIDVPTSRRPWNRRIEIKGARHNNLKGIDVTFPLNVLTVVTGVSGSGKSSLVRDILYRALNREMGESGDRPGEYTSIGGDIRSIHSVEFVDQNPIGRSTRSNPVTYIKAYDEIRKLYAAQPLAKQMGYTPGYFSFNSEGGRCEECKGEGTITVEMQFMSDLVLECESCHGKRFKNDTLLVKYRGKDIHDILEMTVDQAMEFFEEGGNKAVVARLHPLQDVGLGYIKLGQSSSTLSGGENQRVKLAYYLGQEHASPTLFIFDEPTTGLHFHDIKKLFESFNALIDRGHTIVIIEHNMEVIKCADYIIDLGPEGGDAGGNLVVCGTPEEVAACNESYTGRFLREKLQKK